MSEIFEILWKSIVFIGVIGILVFVHEFGHFIVAKLCKVGVLRFSLGFGKPLFSYQVNETKYQVGWIPLGGYVRMVGDMPDMLTGDQETDAAVRDEELDPDLVNASPQVRKVIQDRSYWFIEKGFWPRFSIVAAGPVFNFIFAFLALTFSVFIFGETVAEDIPVIGRVMPESPAEQVGLRDNDLVLAINGSRVMQWEDVANTVHNSNGVALTFSIKRENLAKEITVIPQAKEIMISPTEKKTTYLVGIEPVQSKIPVSLFMAPIKGLDYCLGLTLQTYKVLWGMLSGALSANDLAGPIFIFQSASKHAERGLESIIMFMSLLSVSLAVLNLLPIPVLDGGHLMFFVLESVIGPISIRKKELAQNIGMLLLLLLMAFSIHNDVTRELPEGDSMIKWDKSSSSSVGSIVQETK